MDGPRFMIHRDVVANAQLQRHYSASNLGARFAPRLIDH